MISRGPCQPPPFCGSVRMRQAVCWSHWLRVSRGQGCGEHATAGAPAPASTSARLLSRPPHRSSPRSSSADGHTAPRERAEGSQGVSPSIPARSHRGWCRSGVCSSTAIWGGGWGNCGEAERCELGEAFPVVLGVALG